VNGRLEKPTMSSAARQVSATLNLFVTAMSEAAPAFPVTDHPMFPQSCFRLFAILGQKRNQHKKKEERD
jgi:hypothetical protein